MAKILYTGTWGSENATRAALSFHAANGAKEAGHDPVIALIAAGTLLMKDTIADSVHPVGMPALKELMATAKANNIPIHV